MDREVRCECGRILYLSADVADAEIICDICSRRVPVPTIDQHSGRSADVQGTGLRDVSAKATHSADSEAVEDQPVSGCLIAIIFIVFAMAWTVLIPKAFERSTLTGFATMAEVISQLCIVVLVARNCSSIAILCVLFIPFFSWYFAIRRIDIAKWPLIIGVVAWIVQLYDFFANHR